MTGIQIPLAKPSFDEREVEAVRRVLAGGWVIQGPEVEVFENTIAQMHQARHCVVVSSGTAALHICYLVLGIGSGDAVFIPSFAWPSAANMAMTVGARPVLVDVFPDTYNIDPADLQLRIQECIEQKWATPRAVVPVHEFGLAADMDAILQIAKEYDMEVIEDAACAFGAKYGNRFVATIGGMGIFSFHPRKAITTGEGGAIVTNDDKLAEKCRLWRNHGQTMINGKRDFLLPGLNYRMTEIQAAIGRVQLEKFPEVLAKRRQIADGYLAHLADFPVINLPADRPEHTWQTFMVCLSEHLDRGKVIDELALQGVAAGPGSISAHCLKVYQDRFGYVDSALPVSYGLHERGLALPVYADMTADDIKQVVNALGEVFR
ncbi:DegT/DnrJ/EryC1/StrS aminotransferase family protein [Thermodesulfovibrionales bacterium]|nr:DegT/DnrJ/EryC1/StrS aminotransferase family protein [Thermodesulfovibrionales bacterium]